MKKWVVILFTVFLFFILSTYKINARENKFITVVNPVRVAPYSGKISENIAAQYKITSELNIPATWLITYDVLEDRDATRELLKFKNGEVGLFLEVGSKLAQDSGVMLSEGSWQFANVVFLSGYTQEDRVKLIETLFEKFKEKFGYYPKSVGSWWTDSYSLNYMYEKYGIVANLTVADQFSTDRYQVWGQYWGMPYYPTKYHSAIPASSVEKKLPVVVTQWAPRDPINGYYSSLYSTQDYRVGEVDEDIDYFKRILSLYLNEAGDFGQVTIGLEGDFTPQAYSTNYKEQLKVAREYVNEGLAQFSTMSAFANWYKSKYEDVSPAHIIRSKDLLGENREVVWYMNPSYRAGILSDKDRNEVKIFDLRVYSNNFSDPYFKWPNRSFNLSINIPSIYDEVSNKADVLVFNDTFAKVDEASITLASGKKIDLNELVQSVKPGIQINEYRFRALTLEATHTLKSRKLIILIVISLIALYYLLYKIKSKPFVLLVLLAIVVSGVFLYQSNTQNYWVGQSEVDVLRKLKNEASGRVLVYDNECLQCEWYSDALPAVFANKRSYVEKLAGHRVVFNKSFFEEKNLEEAKRIFDELKVDFIYLVSYGGYSERLPVSPGDVNIEKIYANANAELWKVKND